MMLHGLPDFVLDPSKRGESNTKLGAVTTIKLSLAPKKVISPQWKSKSKQYCSPVHGRISLYTELENTSNTKLDFYFPWYGLWMISMVMARAIYMCV